MRVQVITPFHWDGVLRVRGDVLDGADAALIHDDPHYSAFCVPLADADDASHVADVPVLPAPEPVITPDVTPPPADDHQEE